MENGQYHGARALSRVRRMQGRVHRVQADSDALHACGCGETSERTRADGRSGWLNDRFCSVPPSAHTCWSRARGGHAPPARARAPLAAPRSYRRRRRRRDGRGQAMRWTVLDTATWKQCRTNERPTTHNPHSNHEMLPLPPHPLVLSGDCVRPRFNSTATGASASSTLCRRRS